MKKNALILADGPSVSSKYWKRLVKYCHFIVLDGAANALQKAGPIPDRISGDFDRASPSTLKHWKNKGSKIHATPDQSQTDLQKALAWCMKQKFEKIFLTQALGNRMDHSLSNLNSLKKFHRKNTDLILFTETEIIRFQKNQKISLSGKRNRRIAIVPFPRAIVTSKGLGFEMRDSLLILGKSESVSNHAEENEVTLEIRGSALIIEEGVKFTI